MLHALILVPYYFICSLAVLPFLIVVSRIVRLKVSINALVGTAIVTALASIIVPLACGWLSVAAFSGRPMLVLIGLSFLFAAVDAVLAPRLPLPLDAELDEL